MSETFVRVSGDGTSDWIPRRIAVQHGGHIIDSESFPFEWTFVCTGVTDPDALREELHGTDLGTHCSRFPSVEVLEADPRIRRLEGQIRHWQVEVDRAQDTIDRNVKIIENLQEELNFLKIVKGRKF